MKLLFAVLPALAAAAHIGVVSPIALHREHRARSPGSLALAIPGDSLAEAVLIDGSLNFLSIYGGIITLRILLSWVPQAQSVALLRPVFTVSDLYLNLFRGVIPAIGGLDLSPSACRAGRAGARLARMPPPLVPPLPPPIHTRLPPALRTVAAFFVLNLLTNSVASLGASTEPFPQRVRFAGRVRKEWTKRLNA